MMLEDSKVGTAATCHSNQLVASMGKGEVCPLCNVGRLALFHLNLQEAIIICSQPKCLFPLGYYPIDTLVVSGGRDLCHRTPPKLSLLGHALQFPPSFFPVASNLTSTDSSKLTFTHLPLASSCSAHPSLPTCNSIQSPVKNFGTLSPQVILSNTITTPIAKSSPKHYCSPQCNFTHGSNICFSSNSDLKESAAVHQDSRTTLDSMFTPIGLFLNSNTSIGAHNSPQNKPLSPLHKPHGPLLKPLGPLPEPLSPLLEPLSPLLEHLGPLHAPPGLVPRSPGNALRSPGPAPRSPGNALRSPGPAPRSPGPAPRSPGPAPWPPDPAPWSPGPAPWSPGHALRSPGPVPPSPGPVPPSPGPVPPSPGPVPPSPGPVPPSPGPVPPSPGPVPPSPGPVPPSPGPVPPSPGPVPPSPGPVPPSPGPVPPSPGPVPPSPGPVPPSPGPVPPSPGPVPPSPGPVPSSPGPVPSSPGPVPSSPGPVPSSPGPVPPCPGPVPPSPGPVPPSPGPAPPSPGPAPPSPCPAHPSPCPAHPSPGPAPPSPGPAPPSPGPAPPSPDPAPPPPDPAPPPPDPAPPSPDPAPPSPDPAPPSPDPAPPSPGPAPPSPGPAPPSPDPAPPSPDPAPPSPDPAPPSPDPAPPSPDPAPPSPGPAPPSPGPALPSPGPDPPSPGPVPPPPHQLPTSPPDEVEASMLFQNQPNNAGFQDASTHCLLQNLHVLPLSPPETPSPPYLLESNKTLYLTEITPGSPSSKLLDIPNTSHKCNVPSPAHSPVPSPTHYLASRSSPIQAVGTTTKFLPESSDFSHRLQWQVHNSFCCLDAALSALVHLRILRQFLCNRLPGGRNLDNFAHISVNESMDIVADIPDRTLGCDNNEEHGNEAQDWTASALRLACTTWSAKEKTRRRKAESLVFVLTTLLTETPDLEHLFLQEYSWKKVCQVCGVVSLDRHNHVLPSFPALDATWHPLHTKHSGICAACAAQRQPCTLQWHRLVVMLEDTWLTTFQFNLPVLMLMEKLEHRMDQSKKNNANGGGGHTSSQEEGQNRGRVGGIKYIGKNESKWKMTHGVNTMDTGINSITEVQEETGGEAEM
uniref:uncharacterized protein n=1 Tax=Myxine glutinosa TaxID=7769 RepID=UPI00358F4738